MTDHILRHETARRQQEIGRNKGKTGIASYNRLRYRADDSTKARGRSPRPQLATATHGSRPLLLFIRDVRDNYPDNSSKMWYTLNVLFSAGKCMERQGFVR